MDVKRRVKRYDPEKHRRRWGEYHVAAETIAEVQRELALESSNLASIRHNTPGKLPGLGVRGGRGWRE